MAKIQKRNIRRSFKDSIKYLKKEEWDKLRVTIDRLPRQIDSHPALCDQNERRRVHEAQGRGYRLFGTLYQDPPRE